MSTLIQSNISLQSYNTFGITAQAQHFSIIDNLQQLQESLQWANRQTHNTLILGGGSNVLFTKNIAGLVILNKIKGIEPLAEDDQHIYIKAGGGEVWHQLVMYCVQKGYAGIENLALIPGSVGAAPLQNIGAYGVELKEIFHELTAVHRTTLEQVKFSNHDCQFGYRESVFKHQYKNEFVIVDVTYKLNKLPHFQTAYGAIRQELEAQKVQELSIEAIARAVMSIRSSKLPDPKKIGNAGSFFKNPSVPPNQFQALKKQFPNIVAYPKKDGFMKLAAGWMIEQCGLKGFRHGNAGVHEKQALVLVNYGNATGSQVLELCQIVQDAVRQKFGVMLSPEVNIL